MMTHPHPYDSLRTITSYESFLSLSLQELMTKKGIKVRISASALTNAGMFECVGEKMRERIFGGCFSSPSEKGSMRKST
jgi:hypothetical protein